MALVAAEPAGALVELEFGDSLGSLARLVESQRDLFHSQIDQLQKLVVAQCKLTGVNPLAQEMAAGALSIRIGKRPRDLLNPKAAKYMQSVFSIKDTIGKKETREISALCGVTVTQVREFFAGQRSRVRKIVRLACEKTTKSDASKTPKEEFPCNSDHSSTVSVSQLPSGNFAYASVDRELKHINDNTSILGPVKTDQQVILTSTEPVKAEESRPLLLQEETVPGVDSDDKEFLDKIFNMMRKEQTFSGQVKLIEWVLRIQNSAVLNWFSNNGGVTILATWLNEAAAEEQTTVLLVILKVLYHLPLHKALPLHMSAIVPAVNRLRFYRTSGISNRAKILLSRWSKAFIKSQALKRPLTSSSKAALRETIHKQSMSGFLDDEFLQSKLDCPEEILALTGVSDVNRGTEPKNALKLLPASCADSNKKHERSISSNKSKERRKVLLVEHADPKAAGRSAQVVRAVSINHSRPMSADDIQKAKMRAMFMRHKYGKTEPSSSGSKSQKIEDLREPSVSQPNILSECKSPQDPLKIKEQNRTTVSSKDNILNEPENSNPDPNRTSKQILSCKPIQWKIPQEMRISSTWRVGAGENSKEFDIQSQRNRREKETIYSCLQDIPPNPKEPWDVEMDFDDSLTPEILIEQAPDADADADAGEGSSRPLNQAVEDSHAPQLVPEATTSAPSTTDGTPEPDLELLAVLLKNPDLVFALTSNQGRNLSNEEMVALLDMLKRNGVGLTGMLNESANQKDNNCHVIKPQEQEPLPTSLPSPTPPSEAERSAWRSDFPTFPRTPVLQPHLLGNRSAAALTSAAPQHPPMTASAVVFRTQASGLAPQVMVTNKSATPPVSFLPTKPQAPPPPPPHKPTNMHPLQHTTDLSSKRYPANNTAFISSAPRHESFVVRNPSTTTGLPTLPSLSHNMQRSQPTAQTEPPTFSHIAATWPAVPATTTTRRDPTPDRFIGRPNSAIETSTQNQRYYPTNQNSYGSHPSGSMSQGPGGLSGRRGDRNGYIDGGVDTWRSDGSPARSPEFSAGWSYNDESRRDDSRSNRRHEWSRQHTMGGRDRDGGKRWRDYNHGRQR
ncbi:homeobox protein LUMINIDEPENDENS-like [Canna indica]|uniref:Homeobox protein LUMINIDEPENDENS-like n=1 Tax=Canna indica TaxID=4628 RepID=A0AAQ3KQ74_9LILI|nr:homeobox protein LUMINIDEPENDENS-like [Canna indica]